MGYKYNPFTGTLDIIDSKFKYSSTGILTQKNANDTFDFSLISSGLGSGDILGLLSGQITGNISDDSNASIYGLSLEYVAPTQTNILTDGSFESWTGPTTLTNWNFLNPLGAGTPSANQESSIVYNGTYALRLDSDSSGNWGAIEQNHTGLTAGDIYTFDFYSRYLTSGELHLLIFNNAYADATQIWRFSDSTWQTLTGSEPGNPDYYYAPTLSNSYNLYTALTDLIVPASGNINIIFGGPMGSGSESVYIDFAKLYKTTSGGVNYPGFIVSRGAWGIDFGAQDKNLRIETTRTSTGSGYNSTISAGDGITLGDGGNLILRAGEGAGAGSDGFITTDDNVVVSTTRSLDRNSLQVKSKLETLGKSYFDDDMAILDDKAIIFGTGSDAKLLFDTTTQTNDALVLKLPNANQSLILCDTTNYKNYGFGNNTHPTLYWKSADTNNSKYGYSQYDGNNLLLGTGLGGIVLRPYNGNFIGQNLTGNEVKFLMFNSTSGSGATDGAYFGFGDWDSNFGATFWNFENAGIRFATNNTQAMNIDKNTWVHIGNSLVTPLARLHIGDGSVSNSVDTLCLLSRPISDSNGSGNAHGFSDSSTVTRTGTIGYCSYDGRFSVNGTTNYDHIISFQDAPVINFTGTMGILYGGASIPSLSGGTITNRYGWMTKEFVGSGGSVTNQYGVYVEELSRATNNFAIYTAGATRSYFGGDVRFGSDLYIDENGVISFNFGDATITHSAGLLTVSSALTTSGAVTHSSAEFINPHNINAAACVWTPAYLTGGSSATSVIGTWNAVTDGSFSIDIDGTTRAISGLNFSAAADMDAVAAIIQTGIRTATSSTETCVWSTDHFVISSVNTTSTSAITVASATGSGTDISGAGATDFMDADTGNGIVTNKSSPIYSLLATDNLLHVTVNSTDAMNINLPSAQVVSGRKITIKDASGNATTLNIVVGTESTEKIDGQDTLTISTNYNSVTLYSDGSNWFVI